MYVSAAGAASLELRYDDGEQVSISLEPDGSYEYAVPPDRSTSLAHCERISISKHPCDARRLRFDGTVCSRVV